MRPVTKNYKMHFGFNEPYPDNLKYLSSDGLHKGNDYLAVKGTHVSCAVDGILNFKGFKRSYGNCVIIKFFTGNLFTRKTYRVILAHLDSISIKKNIGEKVSKYEEAGISGDSGSASGHPHLHAQVDKLINGQWVPINPAFVFGAK